MAKMNKTQATLWVLIIFGIIMIGVQWFGQSSRNQGTAAGEQARSKGDPQASVRIVEFVDFQCPACAYGAKMLHGYFQDYSKDMFVQMKYFPLRMHKHSLLAAQYAQCAARQKKFWPVYDLLFERQKKWSSLNNPRPDLDLIAKDATLDMGRLKQCLDDSGVRRIIQKNIDEGKAKGVRSTPTYFINGNMVVGPQALKGALKHLFHEQSP